MAFSLDALSALILFLAASAGWALAGKTRAASRFPIRFAAVLFAALSVAWALGLIGFPELAPAVAMIALSLGSVALALAQFAALARPLPPPVSALALMLALGAGLAAALSAQPLYAVAVVLPAALLAGAAAMGEIFRPHGGGVLALVAMLAIALGGFAFLAGSFDAALLFISAGLIGVARASEAGVETQRERQRLLPISLT